jgi:O-antigen/teichoic acid export membrane protein
VRAQQSASCVALARSLRQLLVLLTSTLVSSVFSFVAQLMLARLLVPDDLGRLVALLAMVNLFTPVAGAGANWFLLQAFGREGWGAARWLRPACALVALMTAFSAAFLGAYATRAHTETAAMAAVIILSGQVMAELGAARLQLTGSFGMLALWQAATQTGRLAAVAALAPVSSAAALTGYAWVGGMTVVAGVVLLGGLVTGRVVLSGHGRFSSQAGSSVTIGKTAREASPFALVTMFYVLYFQGVVIILEWLRGGEAVAQYNAAFLVVSALCLIPNVIYQKLLIASLCRRAVHDRRTFTAAFHLGVVAMGAAGTLLMVFTLVSAHGIVGLLFGHRYEAAAPILMLLALRCRSASSKAPTARCSFPARRLGARRHISAPERSSLPSQAAR